MKKKRKKKRSKESIAWTDNFREFLGLCLKVDPDARAAVFALHQHAFLKNTAEVKDMVALFKKVFVDIGRLTNPI